MPTNLVAKPERKADVFLIFAILVGIAFFAIEVIDPAPMDAEAQSIASP